jgi:hypothetical protein
MHVPHLIKRTIQSALVGAKLHGAEPILCNEAEACCHAAYTSSSNQTRSVIDGAMY